MPAPEGCSQDANDAGVDSVGYDFPSFPKLGTGDRQKAISHPRRLIKTGGLGCRVKDGSLFRRETHLQIAPFMLGAVFSRPSDFFHHLGIISPTKLFLNRH